MDIPLKVRKILKPGPIKKVDPGLVVFIVALIVAIIMIMTALTL